MASFDVKAVLFAGIYFAAGMIAQLIIGANNGAMTSKPATKSRFDSVVTSIRIYDVDGRAVNPTPATVAPAPTTRPVVEEIIPPALRASYSPENLEFNVTRAMLRRSRPIIGNDERLHAYIRKLRSKQCTTVLFLGGSVTDGHHVKGRAANAYPAHFMFWLNERYPCFNHDGSNGTHDMKKTHAQNSQTHFIHWSMVTGIERIDLVFLEFNVNDSFIKDIPHALEDKGEMTNVRQYADLWYSEVLLRRLLLLRKPDPIAIVTFNADYVGASWALPPYGNPTQDRQHLFRRNEEPMKLWISSLYEIPVFSANVWMLPLASKMGTSWQFNNTHNPYSTARWHADRCCHPHKEGHRILVMILAYCIVQEEEHMLQLSNEKIEDVERDMTLYGFMRDPVYLSPEEESLFVLNKVGDAFNIDFTDPDGQAQWNDKVTNDGRWKWYADNRDKDKFGLIVNDPIGGAHMAIAVVGGKFGLVEVSYVVSYENFGISLAWVDNFHNNTNQAQCMTAVNDKVPVNTNMNGTQRLIGIWNEQASVPRVQLLHSGMNEGQKRFFHVCLTPRSKHVKGTDNKFKLLGLRVY
ncbi:hypothetical protein HJC23_004890 [Cyclotella cryptica]|uniref:SGNH hydrolase-type esterase domain-containing protein n=1 Tax=Cyclotella cryptica TaxID=29204 RepID=A0ABD3P6W9_9STRA|eukprot:CCRYP_017565-RA/>CCRYP_017565-RA protein AED:0.01 eAED:0.01 QI:323/1/1/1/1/1/2/1953/577